MINVRFCNIVDEVTICGRPSLGGGVHAGGSAGTAMSPRPAVAQILINEVWADGSAGTLIK